MLVFHIQSEISFGAASVDIDIGDDFSILNWTDGTNDITFDVRYPANSTPNKDYPNTIAKPKSG